MRALYIHQQDTASPAADSADAAIEKAASRKKAQAADFGQSWLNLWR